MRKPLIITTIFLAIAVAWTLISELRSAVVPGQNSVKQPNIVLVIIDTLRADKLGSYGSELNLSPELDALAKNGTVFERVVAQSSWTRSSIGSMLTSLYPRTLGIFKEKWDKLDDQFTTLAELFSAAGYQTVGITANPQINTFFNFHQGFHRYIDSDVVFPWMPPQDGQRKATASVRPHTGAEIFRQALEEIETLSRGSPSYIQINIMDVHGWERVRPSAIDSDLQGLSEAKYLQTVRVASKAVGEFVAKVESLPGWENTLFIITSDHGEGLGDHPDVANSRKHGNLLYESQVIVPLILYNRADSTLAGKRVERPIRLLELLPTTLDYSNVPVPEGIQGVSVLPLLSDPHAAVAIPEHFLTETNWRNVDKTAIYTDGWQFIENRDNWPGVKPQELQAQGVTENGVLTDQGAANPSVVEHLSRGLSAWDRVFPKGAPSLDQSEPSSKEVEQLRTLGYLQ